jgi:hypothetical protein
MKRYIIKKDSKPFKIGDTVIAIADSLDTEPVVVKTGNLYTIRAITYCYECDVQLLNLGDYSKKFLHDCKCGCSFNNRGLLWTPYYLFIRTEDRVKVMEEAAKLDNFELAILLRDVIC